MRGAGAALAALALVAGTPGPASAATPDRQVLLFLVDDLSFEDALNDPLLSRVVEGGGIGLMTTLRGDERGPAAYLSVATGRAAATGPVGVPVSRSIGRGGLLVDVDSFPPGVSTSGVLASELAESGRTIGYLDLAGASADPAMLVAMDRAGRIPLAFQNEFPALGRLSEAVLGAQARPVVERSDVIVSPGLASLRFALQESLADEVLVLAVVPSASEDLRARGDLVTPLLVDRDRPQDVPRSDAPATGLTSATTRREGIVSNLDVAPTILEFLGVPIPEQMVGSPIRAEGEPPRDLHQRYLEYRRNGPVVSVAALLLAIASLVAALAVLFLGGPAPLRRVVAVWVLGSVGALVALQPASLLPSFELPVVAGAVVAVAAVVTWVGLRAGRRGPFVPVAVVAGIGLALEALDAVLGWPTGLTPLLTGGALEGVRFYGLGNTYAGIVLGSAILVAARLGPGRGVALVTASALFAGLPFIGSDLGGGLTLLAAAALWFALRVPGASAATRWFVAGAGFVAGVAFLFAAHRLFPEGAPHIARASGEGLGGLIGSVLGRLGNNLRLTAEAPAAWLALAGLPVWLAVAWRRAGPFRAPLQRDPAWRDAVVTLALGGMIGYVLNDTFGMAAVAFVFLSAAMVFPALRWNAE